MSRTHLATLDDYRPCECSNCDWRGLARDTNGIEGFSQRVAPGQIMPIGECVKCGSLARLRPQSGPTSPLHAFIDRIASMTKDGEDGLVMENDDNFDRLCGLISEARALVAAPPEEPQESVRPERIAFQGKPAYKFHFDWEDTRGDVIVQSGGSGLCLFMPHIDPLFPVCAVDLYYNSPLADEQRDRAEEAKRGIEGRRAGLWIFKPFRDEPIGQVWFTSNNTIYEPEIGAP